MLTKANQSMVIIEKATDFLYVCDYNGYCNGQTYYITKVNRQYVAKQSDAKVQIVASTLKNLSLKLLGV
jgi:hypothetical protein